MFKIAAVMLVSGLLSAILGAPPKTQEVPATETESAANYGYAWDVIDDFKGIDVGHTEDRTSGSTKGHYWVLLPDGRRQVVNYSANPKTGYTVKISYDSVSSTH